MSANIKKLRIGQALPFRWSGLAALARLKPAEVAATLLLLICIGAVIFLYISTLAQKVKLSGLQGTFEKNRGQIQTLTQQMLKPRISPQEALGQITDSIERFNALLKDRRSGQITIIDEINTLTRQTQVALVDRVSFSPFKENEIGTEADLRKHQKEVVVYPGMALELTVEGQYPNLRRFINEIERSKNFIVINAVSFQGIEEQQRGSGAHTGGRRAAPAQIARVALKLQMETYFKR